MQELVKSMNKTQIAVLFGWCATTLTKWMLSVPELAPLAKKKGTGTYLYTNAEIQLIISIYNGKKD